MKAPVIDLTLHDSMIGILESILQHRRAQPRKKADEIYYELLVKYHQRIRNAKAEGKLLGAHTVIVPPELFYAMDMVPMHLEGSAMTLAPVLNRFEEIFGTAKSYGMTPEICSAHRCLAGEFIKGWVPRPDIIVWSNQVCDNTSKSGELLMELYETPGFFLDRPYRFNDKEVAYFTKELGDMVSALEKVAGHKMDWDKLRDTLRIVKRMVDLNQEIYDLRKLVPCPMSNRRSIQLMFIGWLYIGDPESIRFFEAVRDEVKEAADQGVGAFSREDYRLISLFLPPLRNMHLLDWMQREHGASVVADPYCSHWGEFEWDFDQPLLTIARRSFACPICRQMHGPVEEGVVEDSLNDARSHKAEGAIYWAHIGCRQACATIKTVKDTLKEQLGIPTLVVDIDILDPTFTSEGEIKEKLEGFFETLQERK